MTKSPHTKPTFICDKVHELIGAGLSNREVSDRLGCTMKYAQEVRRRGTGRAQSASSWNDERHDALKKLWADGLSASQIARRLGGVTRSAVIGKVHRLVLPPRNTSTRTPHPTRKRPISREAANKHPNTTRHQIVIKAIRQDGLPLPEPGKEDIARVSFVDLEHYHCKFPCWRDEPPPVHQPAFCGASSVIGASYCETHLRRTHDSPNPSRRVAAKREMQVA